MGWLGARASRISAASHCGVRLEPGIVNLVSEQTAQQYLTVPDLVEIFGIPVGKVHRLIEDHYLAGTRVDGIFKVPAEFVQDGQPLASLRGTVLALLDAGFSNDESLAWLLEPNDELGERPIDSLVAGRKSAVRRATQGLAF